MFLKSMGSDSDVDFEGKHTPEGYRKAIMARTDMSGTRKRSMLAMADLLDPIIGTHDKYTRDHPIWKIVDLHMKAEFVVFVTLDQLEKHYGRE